MRAYLLPDHPVIRRAQRHGMDEPEVIGWCERCDDPIYTGYEHGRYEDMLFCDTECFLSWIGYEVVD